MRMRAKRIPPPPMTPRGVLYEDNYLVVSHKGVAHKFLGIGNTTTGQTKYNLQRLRPHFFHAPGIKAGKISYNLKKWRCRSAVAVCNVRKLGRNDCTFSVSRTALSSATTTQHLRRVFWLVYVVFEVHKHLAAV